MSRRCGCLFPFSLLLISFTDYIFRSFFSLPSYCLSRPAPARIGLNFGSTPWCSTAPFSVRNWPSSHLTPTHLHTASRVLAQTSSAELQELVSCPCTTSSRSSSSARSTPAARAKQLFPPLLLYFFPLAFVYQPSLMLLCPSYPSGFRFVLPRRKEQSSCFTPPSGLSPRELERDCTHASQIAVCKCSAANAHSALAEAKLSRGRTWRSLGFQDTCALRHLQ